jgi:hypothetical protein
MRIARIVLAAGALGLGGIGTSGCLSNACLWQVCDGPTCRCTVANCGPGATFEPSVGRCRCLPGLVLVGGHCLTRAIADTYCGPGYHWENNGCYANRTCRPGDELDQATGLCMPRDKVNQVASGMGINVGPGQKLGCPAGQKLVIDGPHAACVPLEQTCARDETWNGTACVKTQAACPEGTSWDAAHGGCAEPARATPAPEPAPTDLAPWIAASYGRDGGDGAPAFCNDFVKKPWLFGVAEGSSAFVRITVSLSFPEQQIGKGAAQTRAVFAGSGNLVPQKGAAEVEAAARSVLAPLTARGGKASAAAASTTVRCQVVNAARPAPIPATGGL